MNNPAFQNVLPAQRVQPEALAPAVVPSVEQADADAFALPATHEAILMVYMHTLGELASRLTMDSLATPTLMPRYASRTPTKELRYQAELAAISEGWAERDPKEVIDALILELPDEAPLSPASQEVPPNEPSRLEQYFMSMLPDLSGVSVDYNRTGSLSPKESINCLRDKVRTKLFLQGIAEAVSQLDTATQDTIEVCDAGTGAIPVMAIYAALCSDKVRCTALELNPQSAILARRVVARFGLQDRITVIEADATKYTPSKPFDLLVSETMHSGLTEEPIVQILSNLQPHVKQIGLTLPSSIDIQAALVPFKEYEEPQHRIKILKADHAYLAPDWQHVLCYVPGRQLDKIAFTLDGTDLPDGKYVVAVTNRVHIGSKILEPSQSLITMPQYVMDFGGFLRKIEFAAGANHASEVNVEYRPGGSLNGAAQYK